MSTAQAVLQRALAYHDVVASTPAANGVPDPYPLLNDSEVRAAAFAERDRLVDTGAKCYVRSWNLGKVGYFVILTDAEGARYDRVWPDFASP